MITLINQLKDDIKTHFSALPEYSKILVKEKYERYPKMTYPAIILEEIENSDATRYFDETERVSNLGYQFTIESQQSSDKTAIQNVRQIAEYLDNYLKGDRYRCLKRLGSLTMAPLPNDDNVIVGYLRYDCCVEIDTNTIYRRY